jgi:hypothetical protein
MKALAEIEKAEERLRRYCEAADFRGWDPWDGLASPLLQFPPFNLRLPRWGANHLIKIAPINIRPLLGIKKDCFAKGLALFLSAYALRQKRHPSDENLIILNQLRQRLFDKQIIGYSGACWGTNVAYQTRAFFVPAQTPSLVHTAFAVEALLDLHDLEPNDQLIKTAQSACRFALQDLRIRQTGDSICFSYTPLDDSRVINVTALAARMLARTGKLTGDSQLLDLAGKAMRYVEERQEEDGSWLYGQDPVHHWIDNYHTGFVLDALNDYAKISGADSLKRTISRGLELYRQRLFAEDGCPKFSPNSVYPIDGHCLAQGILTFSRYRRTNPEYFDFALKIAQWGIRNFQHPRGYFYFQRTRYWLNRIPHIRWVQAWMLLALNRLIVTAKD